MQAAMFIASAEAAAPNLFTDGARVGPRVEAAMEASLGVAGCNTNLGIVLLAAPLAVAFEQADPSRGAHGLRSTVEHVLHDLDVEDAAAAFRAIAATQPGGLGRVQAHDVAEPATITLLEAMVLAAGRDRVAHQYASAYDDVFGVGIEVLTQGFDAAHRLGIDPAAAARHAMLGLYLELLARVPDSHIARRHGLEVAHTVMAQTLAWRHAWIQGQLREGDEGLARWDAALKQSGLNPGTTADLCVAGAMVAAWLEPSIVVPLRERPRVMP